jgi:hypothetical protein
VLVGGGGSGPGQLDGGRDGGQHGRVGTRGLAQRQLGAGATTTTTTPTTTTAAHSGMLPCLRRGNSSRLEARMSRLRQITARVSAGEMTSSM